MTRSADSKTKIRSRIVVKQVPTYDA